MAAIEIQTKEMADIALSPGQGLQPKQRVSRRRYCDLPMSPDPLTDRGSICGPSINRPNRIELGLTWTDVLELFGWDEQRSVG